MISSLTVKRKRVEDDTIVSSRRRKRVAFASDSQAMSGSSSRADHENRWIPKPSVLATVRAHAQTVAAVRESEAVRFAVYSNLLAATYRGCVMHGETPAHNGVFSYCQFANSLGVSSEQLRGLEGYVLSSIATDRLQRRRRHVATMVKAQKVLTKYPDKDALARQLSEKMAATSTAFAAAMGAADAAAALMEHTAGAHTHKRTKITVSAFTSTKTTPSSAAAASEKLLCSSGLSRTMVPSDGRTKKGPCSFVSPVA
jgi:hypothetical protein